MAEKIYTKTGDGGATSLFGGARLRKNSPRINAYGTVDELNSLLGVAIGENPPAPLVKKLLRVQSELFILGSELSTPNNVKVKIPRIKKPYTTRLEREIDSWQSELPTLKNFILPGGNKASATLHLARTTARRAEREIVALSEDEKLNKNILPYINRLSDWLFVAARYINKINKVNETIWRGRS